MGSVTGERRCLTDRDGRALRTAPGRCPRDRTPEHPTGFVSLPPRLTPATWAGSSSPFLSLFLSLSVSLSLCFSLYLSLYFSLLFLSVSLSVFLSLSLSLSLVVISHSLLVLLSVSFFPFLSLFFLSLLPPVFSPHSALRCTPHRHSCARRRTLRPPLPSLSLPPSPLCRVLAGSK